VRILPVALAVGAARLMCGGDAPGSCRVPHRRPCLLQPAPR